MTTPLRIGIPVLGGPHWMAGVTYVEMLARSVHALGDRGATEIHLVVQPESLPHVELHLPFLRLFRSVIVLLHPGMDPAPYLGRNFPLCRDRDELFRRIDFFYPVLSDVWETGASASWIPDFQHRYLPHFFPESDRAHRDVVFARIAAKARLLVLSSRTVERDFRKFYPESRAETEVLRFYSYVGEDAFAANPAAVAAKYSLPSRYLLCCNQFWVHKDHMTLVKALAAASREGLDIPLVCTGSTSDYRADGYFAELQRTLVALGLEGRIRILGMVPREDRIQIIRRSCALVQPSLFEGWSSIVEDAKSLGKAIFLSDLEVHREQAPPQVRFFQAGEPASLAAALREGFPGLAQGPDMQAEREAMAETRRRIREFGEAFRALAAKGAGRASGTSLPTLSSAPQAVPGRDWEAVPPSGDLLALVVRAEEAYGSGRVEEAERILNTVLVREPGNARALNNLGVIHYARGERQQAMQRFMAAVKADHGYFDAVLNLAETMRASGMEEEALGLLYQFQDDHPDDERVVAALIAVEEDIADAALRAARVRDLNYRPKAYRATALVSTYASAEFIRECLEDLEGQTIASDLEIIVIDASSPQDEGSVVEEFQRRYTNIRYIRTAKRIGIYPAWNLAIRASTGRYLTPMSTNDRLAPDAYEKMILALEADGKAALVYGDSHLTRLPHQKYGAHVPSPDYGGAFRWPPYSYEDLLVYCRVGPHPLWKRDIHGEIGYFDGRYKAIGDQDFWLRLGLRHPLLHIPVFTGLAWITKESLSGQDSAMQEIQDIHAKHTSAQLNRLKRKLEVNLAGSPAENSPVAQAPSGSPGARPADASGTLALLPGRFRVTTMVSVDSDHRSEASLRGCLEDLVGQTLFRSGEMEIVVVDSGSPDGAAGPAGVAGVVEVFQKEHAAIVYMRTGPEAPYSAWNRAVQGSRGTYLVGAGTEVRHQADALARLAGELDRTGLGIAYADCLLTHGKNETYEANTADRVWALPDFSVRQALVDSPFGCLVMWRRDLHAELGFFDESFRSAGDYEFFLKASIARGALHVGEALGLRHETAEVSSRPDSIDADAEVERFLKRARMGTPLSKAYPFLAVDPSPEAEGHALADLGTSFLLPGGRTGPAEAEALLRRAMERLGELPQLRNNLALAVAMQGRHAEAAEMLSDLVRREPGLAPLIGSREDGPLRAKAIFSLDHPGVKALGRPKLAYEVRLPLREYTGAAQTVPARPSPAFSSGRGPA